MKTALFFGDSLTSGDNNNGVSYVDYVKYDGEVHNFGVSGTTFGDYSLYPVGKNCLLDRLMDADELTVKFADDIYIELGINDSAAVAAGNITIPQVIVSAIKCIDYIRQVNHTGKIHFIWLSYEALEIMATLQSHYLVTDYLKCMHLDELKLKSSIQFCYANLVSAIAEYSDVDSVFAIKGKCFTDMLDSDNIHPTDAGYRLIAESLQ